MVGSTHYLHRKVSYLPVGHRRLTAARQVIVVMGLPLNMEPFSYSERLSSMADNDTYTYLLDIFMAATPDERQTGAYWYSDARAAIDALADEVGINRNVLAGVVAALSPRVRWATNLDAAARMCRAAVKGQEQPRVAGFGHNRDIAWQIANGGSASLITGPKTMAFFQNLIGNENEVTVDVWMLRAAGTYEPNKTNMDNVAESIKKIARYRRLTPAQVQAIIWTVIRDRWNAND